MRCMGSLAKGMCFHSLKVGYKLTIVGKSGDFLGSFHSLKVGYKQVSNCG